MHTSIHEKLSGCTIYW